MATDKTTLPKPRKVRGTGIYMGDEFTFKPAEEGQPSQLNVKTCKGAKTFETTSETKPLRVAHLTCAANAADPYSVFVGQLERLGIKPLKPQQLSTRQRVVAEGDVEVYIDQKHQRLIYQGSIELKQSRNWQSEVMRQLQVIVRTLPGNEVFKKIITKSKKGGLNHV